MAKYHISLSGEPAVCKARTKPCPRTEHYDDLETAQQVAEMAHEAYAEALEYPRSGHRFATNQARLFWEMDYHFGSAVSPHITKGGLAGKEANAARFEDYRNGFETGLLSDEEEREAALVQYRADNDVNAAWPNAKAPTRGPNKIKPVLIDDTAYKLGFARAQRTKDADRAEFITENILDRGLRGGQAREKYGRARLLRQPFKRGETIVVPAGTKFHSWDAAGNDVWGELKEAREIQINDTFDPYIDGTADWVQIHPAQVSYAGPHGYWRDIVLTPEIVAANGKPLYEAAVGMEEIIRKPLYMEAGF